METDNQQVLSNLKISMDLNSYFVDKQSDYDGLLISKPTDHNFDFQQIIDDCTKQLISYNKDKFDIYYLKDRNDILDAWYAFEFLWIDKKIMNAGVEDISLFKLNDIIKNCYIKPSVYLLKENINDYYKIKDLCKEYNILIVYYLTSERLNELNHNQMIQSLKDKYGCSTIELLKQLSIQLDIVLTSFQSIKSYKNINLNQDEIWTMEKICFQSYKIKSIKNLS